VTADAVGLHERLARVEEQVRVNTSGLAELHQEVHGPPRDDSVKGRLHKLETVNAVESAATSALEALKAQTAATATAGEAKAAGRDRRLSLAAAFIALLVTLHPWHWVGLG
jgi:Flp pilus assembly protein TadD